MQLAGLDVYYQYIAKGFIMLAAIGFDIYQLSRRHIIKNTESTQSKSTEATARDLLIYSPYIDNLLYNRR